MHPTVFAPSMPELPADLQLLQWEHRYTESGEIRRMSGTTYKLVYERKFDPDHEGRLFNVVTRDGNVRISVRGVTWEQAFQFAVENMRSVDSRRTD